jgi:hypothetical protein
LRLYIPKFNHRMKYTVDFEDKTEKIIKPLFERSHTYKKERSTGIFHRSILAQMLPLIFQTHR